MKNGDLGYDQMQPNTLKHSDDKPEIDFWSGLPSEIKQAIDRARAELDRGEGVLHSRVMADVKSTFLNK
ncbi:hypothetical protein [Mucilaginibacter gotjawali]|uniref:Uncharacterized protein n=1 Tax=Mucilaginibacter gotjawali TaxID=1550579 RepID=A0A839S9B9_9SPHI|nr:hypothetical protein [Mucilaginibacter gotjawali]MBB3054731.1 hypothetical protein [Mucilaginibacter gotjawali]